MRVHCFTVLTGDCGSEVDGRHKVTTTDLKPLSCGVLGNTVFGYDPQGRILLGLVPTRRGEYTLPVRAPRCLLIMQELKRSGLNFSGRSIALGKPNANNIVTSLLLTQPPQPYAFNYNAQNPHEGSSHFHEEQADGNNVRRGSYGYTDAYGNYRRVDYTADATGFHPVVSSNEQGVAPSAPAGALYHATGAR